VIRQLIVIPFKGGGLHSEQMTTPNCCTPRFFFFRFSLGQCSHSRVHSRVHTQWEYQPPLDTIPLT
jgi:hypothetical protein